MISGEEGQSLPVLAQRQMTDLGPRQNMRKKWGRGPMNSEYFAEVWKHGVRNNSSGIV